MIPATRKDKPLVVQILTEAFQENLQINWIVSPADEGRDKRLRVLMELAFETGLAEEKYTLPTTAQEWLSENSHLKASFPAIICLLSLSSPIQWGCPACCG